MLGTQQKQLFAGCLHGPNPFIFYLRGCSKSHFFGTCTYTIMIAQTTSYNKKISHLQTKG